MLACDGPMLTSCACTVPATKATNRTTTVHPHRSPRSSCLECSHLHVADPANLEFSVASSFISRHDIYCFGSADLEHRGLQWINGVALPSQTGCSSQNSPYVTGAVVLASLMELCWAEIAPPRLAGLPPRQVMVGIVEGVAGHSYSQR
jgi:hypothetical protein